MSKISSIDDENRSNYDIWHWTHIVLREMFAYEVEDNLGIGEERLVLYLCLTDGGADRENKELSLTGSEGSEGAFVTWR